MNSIPISETVTLKSLGLDEAWLQAQIWENPSCLNLGDLEAVTKERAVSSGGRLDILLKNPVDDSMYEVETALGDTDPGHIVRTIEYWDLVKRKWPQRQHYAVLVAERITKRFFNVISILSDAVPLIAVQVNVVKSPHGLSLHFTKILDVYEEPEDAPPDDGTYDEAYWQKKSNETLETAKFLLNLTAEVYDNPELRFNKNYIVIASCGYNQLAVRKRSSNNVLVGFRYGDKRDEILELLESNGIQYSEQHQRFRFQMTPEMLKEKAEMLVQIAKLNKEWWTG
jgi:hypothetical protein